MHAITLVTVFMAALYNIVLAQTTTDPVTGTLGNASIPENNPVGLVYTATLPQKQFFNPDDPRGNVQGSISATANPDGIGVRFVVNFSNLPTSGGPFVYHLHVAPVPEDGNCNDTLGHLDPFIRGETPACESSLPQTCQVGDLSGKHGKVVDDPFSASYADDFASTIDGLGSFFGNRSLVVHFANKTRITCANFKLEGTPTNGTANATSTDTPIQFTGASAKTMVPTFALMVLIGITFAL